MGERVTEPATQQIHDRKGESRQEGVHHIEQRRDEQERELQRLGDPGEEGGQCAGQHDRPDAGPILRLRRPPDRQGRSRQAEHLGEEPATEDARLRVPGEEAGQDAVAVAPAADVQGEEERGVPDVVQPEREQGALDETVDEHGDRRVRLHDPVRADVDEIADRRPDEGQHDAEGDRGERRDDRDEPLAGEEAQV